MRNSEYLAEANPPDPDFDRVALGDEYRSDVDISPLRFTLALTHSPTLRSGGRSFEVPIFTSCPENRPM